MFGKRNIPQSLLQKRREIKLSSEDICTSSSTAAKKEVYSNTSISANVLASSSSSPSTFNSFLIPIQIEGKEEGKGIALEENENKNKENEKELKVSNTEYDSIKQSGINHEEDDEEIKSRVKDYKLIQKNRKRNKGLNAQKIFVVEEKEEDEEEMVEYGLLDKQFTTKDDTITAEIDAHLEEYLKNRLEKKVETKEVKESSNVNDKAAELYKIPKHLQVKDTISQHADRMNWVTGLMEVSLPLEVKLKNIEATEKAKRALLKLGKTEQNLSEDPDFIVSKAFGDRFQNFERIPRSKASTDKITLDRFKKRMRNK